ncbi:MAG TPA: alpha/beta hydrolase [Stellaceae bacterium]|nr:alpha/beta hydrolase [Stellaceae bacterium]
MPDSLSPVLPPSLPPVPSPESPIGARLRHPVLPERFLPPDGFVWGSFIAADGAVLRWGHLPVSAARAECVLVGGFGEFIEKQFETVRDLAARGIAVWCLDWRGQGGSTRPRRLPTRPRARNFDRDAEDLAAFAAAKLTGRLPPLLVAHSMGGAIALLCLKRHPGLFAAAVLSSPMVGLRTGRVPPTLIRCITGTARAAGLGACFIPGARKWRPDHLPSPERSRITTDAERCRLRHAWFSADPGLRLDQATYGWVDSALGLVARISKPEFLTDIKTPILFGRAGREVVVSRKAQRRAARLLPDCRLVELRDSKHDPFLERDAIRDYWLSCLDSFIAERLLKTTH